MPKIFMVEPEWWFDFLLAITELWEKYPWVGNFYPIGADIFVFVYPVFLTVLYLYGMVKKNRESKKAALFIFFACFFSVVVNILSQQFFDKQRPIHELGIVDVDQETLLHHLLPLTSFPSDHAVVTFSIAMATWLISHKYRKMHLKIWSFFLFVFAILTGICRIGTKVHWTTDILAWAIMGLLVPVVLVIPFFYKRIESWILIPIIRFEEWILGKIKKK